MQENTNANLEGPQAELSLQSDCFKWFHNTFHNERKMLFHVNNKARNAIEGNKFKAMGVVTGVSDFILVLTGEVVFIELKNSKGRQSEDQASFEAKVLMRGHNYYIVRSLQQFQKLVISLLKGIKPEMYEYN